MAGERVEVFSAGSKPSRINPFAIEAMRRRGIDISGQRSKHLNESLNQPFDTVITVCDHNRVTTANSAESSICPVQVKIFKASLEDKVGKCLDVDDCTERRCIVLPSCTWWTAKAATCPSALRLRRE